MTSQTTPIDQPAEQDIRPVVAQPHSNRGAWLFGAGLLLGALLLFQALEARRASVTAPAITAPRNVDGSDFGAVPSLYIPPPLNASAVGQADNSVARPPVIALQGPDAGPVVTADRRSRSGTVTSPYPAGYPGTGPAVRDSQSGSGSFGAPTPPLTPAIASPQAQDGSVRKPVEPDNKDRVKASRFANPSSTVPKGTVVQAVLESALDSTRGGFARALVSRDIYAFDGSRVLIPRGSRILGEYKSDVALGQKRILIQWQRLMRPDGVMIDLDSPSADPLGRAGTRGSVNTHFFERFSGAILQSSLNIGAQLAARAATHDTVILALPGSVSQAGQVVQPDKISPTVTVRQGSSVSVFVAKDLDFTDIER